MQYVNSRVLARAKERQSLEVYAARDINAVCQVEGLEGEASEVRHTAIRDFTTAMQEKVVEGQIFEM